MLENYLMINKTTNVVENVSIWDGNPQTWVPPENTLMLAQATTPAKVWVFVTSIDDYELQTTIGEGQIGFSWDGVECITNEPKPEKPEPKPEAEQPNTSGTQTL